VKNVRKEVSDDLAAFFRGEKRVLVAYLFGSHAKKTSTAKSDIDIAVFLSLKLPKNCLNITYT